MIDAPVRTAAPRPQRSRLWRKIARRPVGIAAFVVLVLMILAVSIGPSLVPHSPTRTNALNILKPPSATNLLGTDELGRDVLARLLSGGRVSLAVGLFSMLVGLSIGIAVGGTAGYFGGSVEGALMRVVDTFMAIPTFFLILVIVTSFGNHPITIIVTVGLGFWAQMARVAHAEFKRFRNHEFVEASKALGGSHLRVMARHILAAGAAASHRPRHPRGRLGDPHRGGAQLPRARHPTAARLVGQHAPERPGVPLARARPGRLAGPVHRRDRPLVQPPRQRAARRARPARVRP